MKSRWIIFNIYRFYFNIFNIFKLKYEILINNALSQKAVLLYRRIHVFFINNALLLSFCEKAYYIFYYKMNGNMDGYFLDCDTSSFLHRLREIEVQHGMNPNFLVDLFRNRIKHLLFGCFNTDARTPFGRYVSEEVYPFTENGHFYVSSTVSTPIQDVNVLIEYINHMTSVLYIFPENENDMIYNVCKLPGSPAMNLLFNYTLRRHDELNPDRPLFLGVDIWNRYFNAAFDLYVKNRFEFSNYNHNLGLIYLRYNPAIPIKTNAEAQQYRHDTITHLIQNGYQNERLMALRYFGKKSKKIKHGFFKKSRSKNKGFSKKSRSKNI